MKNYPDSVRDFVFELYYEDDLRDTPLPMTLSEAAYNLDCLIEDEYTDVPEGLTAGNFMIIWNELVNNGGHLPDCTIHETDVELSNKTEEEKKTKSLDMNASVPPIDDPALITLKKVELECLEIILKEYRSMKENDTSDERASEKINVASVILNRINRGNDHHA